MNVLVKKYFLRRYHITQLVGQYGGNDIELLMHFDNIAVPPVHSKWKFNGNITNELKNSYEEDEI